MNLKIIRYLSSDSAEEWSDGEIVADNENWVEITLGVNVSYETLDGSVLVQKDYRVDGEVWQVHKADPDPFPSRPHAHCVGGRKRYVGLKLHLGTRQLWNGPQPMNLLLHKKPFARLVHLIRPKFPNVILPIPNCEPSAVKDRR